MIQKIKNTIFIILYFSCIPFFVRELIQKNKVTIITYHDLKYRYGKGHIEALKKRYNFISLQDYLSILYSKDKTIKFKKGLVVTFDDGFASNYELLETFKKNKLRPTIFICSDIINTKRHFWWTHVNNKSVLEEIKKLPDEIRIGTLMDYNYYHLNEYNNRQTLTISELSKMKPHVDFQSHTRTHPILTTCTDNKSFDEINTSKKLLETQLGLHINALAYPNGSYSDREKRYAVKSGYKCALSLKFGFNNYNEDPYEVKRFCIPDDAANIEAIVRTSGVWDFFRNKYRRFFLRQ